MPFKVAPYKKQFSQSWRSSDEIHDGTGGYIYVNPTLDPYYMATAKSQIKLERLKCKSLVAKGHGDKRTRRPSRELQKLYSRRAMAMLRSPVLTVRRWISSVIDTIPTLGPEVATRLRSRSDPHIVITVCEPSSDVPAANRHLRSDLDV